MARTAIPSKENLVQRSEEFDNAYWFKSGLGTTLADQAANPINGAVTADAIVENSSAGQHNISDTTAPTVNNKYNASYYIFPVGRTECAIWVDNASRQAGIFTLSGAGSVSGVAANITSSITALSGTGAGWYLLEINWIATVTSTHFARIYASSGGSASFTGSGATAFYLYGAMVCHNHRGPYTQTTSAAVNTGALRATNAGRVAVSGRVATSGRVTP